MEDGESLPQARANQDETSFLRGEKTLLRDLADYSRVIVSNHAITTSRSDMITHDRWQRIKDVFNSAQDRPPAERSAFLNEVCGDDPSVREEVEALLSADESNDDFLSYPAYEFAAGMLASEASEFPAGQKIGRFEIQCMLGAGGMGQIYLAHDANLGRKIALKLIAREFATDAHRVHRFEQEARAASTLNHPNVCVIHDVGITETGRHFIAMEYIQGITLRDHLSRGTLKLIEALQVTLQAGAALASAHAFGIVHRDIKPENIMLRPDGYVKVVDFGLAKLTEVLPEQRRSGEVSTRVLTEPRMLMGTVKYMSPEQLREGPVDERTDIWSLGIVLYEMLTGATPFEARSRNDSIALILSLEPARLMFPDHVPPELREIIKKALEKDSEKRYQTVTKLTADVSRLKKELERNADNYSATIPEVQLSAPQIDPLKTNGASRIFTRLKSQAVLTADTFFSEVKTHRKAALFAGVSSVIALLVFVNMVSWIKAQWGQESSPSLVQKPTWKPSQFTNTGISIYAAISPDGNLMAQVEEQKGKQRLVLTSTTTFGSNVVVPPQDDGQYLGVTFSRDGYLYFTRKEKDSTGVLYRVALPGSAPVQVARGVDSPISLSPEGDRFAFVRHTRGTEYLLMLANIEGTKEQVLASRQDGVMLSVYGLAWSPDGQTVYCPESRWKPSYHTKLIAFDVNTKREELIGEHSWFQILEMAWHTDTSSLIVTAREQGSAPFQLWQINLADGTAERMTDNVDDYRGVSIAGEKIVTIRTNLSWKLWVSKIGEPEQATIMSGNGLQYGIAWTSKDKIVYSAMAQSRQNIFSIDPDGAERLQLTVNAGNNYTPSVSADGRLVLFASDRNGPFNIWRINAEDGSEPVQLTFTDGNFYPSASSDNEWVAYDNQLDSQMSVWKVPMQGGEPVKIGDKYRMPVFSPNNQLVACRYDEDSDADDVAIFPAHGGRALYHVAVPKQEWQVVRWLGNNHQLSYVTNDDGYSNIWSYDLRTGVRKQLTNFNSDQIYAYAWSPDYKQLASQRGTRSSDVMILSQQ
jgi:serine/threonine protein kinase